MLYRIILLFTSSVLTVTSGAQNPLTTYTKESRAKFTKTPVTVNGILSEWPNGDSIFFQDWHKRGDDDNRASVKIAWDRQKLYLAYRVWDTKLNARYMESNKQIFTDDCVELYISTNYGQALEDKLTTREHQFVININSALSTIRGKDTPVRGDPGKDFNWKPDVFAVVKTSGTVNNNLDVDSGYVVEVAINWGSIGYTPKVRDTLLFDLCVEDRDDSTAYYPFDISFLPQYFSQPKRWWRLILEDNAPSVSAAKSTGNSVQKKTEDHPLPIFLVAAAAAASFLIYYFLRKKRKKEAGPKELPQDETSRNLLPPHYEDLVKKVILIIQAEYKNDIKTGEVADRVHISERHLQRILKESTGKRFRQYLNEVRIKKSMELLKDEVIPLNEIAFKVGYQSYSHFIKIFKLYNQGISPHSFREQNRQNSYLKTT